MNNFRNKFELGFPLLKWYPSHMARGYRQMEKTLKRVDCILEVHDSRIGRNSRFIKTLTTIKPHILILNKVDLLDMRYKMAIESKMQKSGVSKVIFVNCMESNPKLNGLSEILPSVVNIIRNSDRYNREDFDSFNLMIIGIPNVGKSTIINRLRNECLGVGGKATITGSLPGVTKSVLERIKVNQNPPIYLFDTPGVLAPDTGKNIEATMRCALCATISNPVIGEEIIADYLLYWLNKHYNYSYVEYFGLDKPTDNIKEVLVKGAFHLNNLLDVRQLETNTIIKCPQLTETAQTFIRAFRFGKFGRVVLDDDIV